MTRSKLDNCDKTLCIICRQPGGYLCKVEFKHIGRAMLSVAEKLTDKSFLIRLNTITQADVAIANDMYHNLCWAKAQKKAEPKGELADSYSKTVFNFIETNILQNLDIALGMKFFNTTYHAILIESDVDPKSLSLNYKILESISDRLIVSSTQVNVLKTLSNADETDIHSLWKVAKNSR